MIKKNSKMLKQTRGSRTVRKCKYYTEKNDNPAMGGQGEYAEQHPPMWTPHRWSGGTSGMSILELKTEFLEFTHPLQVMSRWYCALGWRLVAHFQKQRWANRKNKTFGNTFYKVLNIRTFSCRTINLILRRRCDIFVTPLF
jgi:hypothetical protein